MVLTDLHAFLFGQACESVLGTNQPGSMAFVRCLTGDVAEGLAKASMFMPQGWDVWRVADYEERDQRTITADSAVEIREIKGNPTLLIVDSAKAGAGMDGIYSAAREIGEEDLFPEAFRIAAGEIKRVLSQAHCEFAMRAVKKARGRRHAGIVSSWTAFDYYVQVASARKFPGDFLYILGLWPIAEVKGQDDITALAALDTSVMFVQHLFGTVSSGMAPRKRIESLHLANPGNDQLIALETFLHSSTKKPLLTALADLADKSNLWINELRIEDVDQTVQSINLLSWRNQDRVLQKWSGLIIQGTTDDLPVFIISPDADKTSNYSKLEIRWKTSPSNLKPGSIQYRVAIVTEMDEELVSHEITHSAKEVEKCRFTNDDFSELPENALIPAKVRVSIIGNSSIQPSESEEFKILFGEHPDKQKGGIGSKVRAFSEGLIELEDRNIVTDPVSSLQLTLDDSKGFVHLRLPDKGKNFRVFRPSLISEIEKQWFEHHCIGRWIVKARASGARADKPEFIAFSKPVHCAESWDRVEVATRRFAERLATTGGGVGQIYDDKSKVFETTVKEYLLAWANILEQADPSIALANTVEVQTLSGRTIGLIVLPSHPLRVAWHVAYDNLVFNARFEQNMAAKEIRAEMAVLDGTLFPAFLPGLDGESTFVFADMLGFHAVGMLLDRDTEPKASIAILAKVFSDVETEDALPFVSNQSSKVLGDEIIRYLRCHYVPKILSVHALRPGDGLTIARALGRVYHEYIDNKEAEDIDEEEIPGTFPAFLLELYPSEAQHGIAGRFIAEARKKRRSGAGVLSDDDRWMLESLSLREGINLPRLRWARKDSTQPENAAHLAVAFDTFDSNVDITHEAETEIHRSIYGFGLLSFFERRYSSKPQPLWRSYVATTTEGEKHPSDRFHTERLLRINQVLQKCTARNLGGTTSDQPFLRTEIAIEKENSLRKIHSLCDWVVTVDRNAGIEYFDSPNENPDVFDAYVIDCVPEREDLGCLQLITSTSNIEEIRNLVDRALDQMGLSRSLRNTEFLFKELKILSGRLAIRLTGQKAPTSELIALALSHNSCREAPETDDRWPSLKTGFFIPVDDVQDLLPSDIRDGATEETNAMRPDLIHVSISSRKALLFRFVEVKYRRHLRTARNPDELQHIQDQILSFRDRWDKRYSAKELNPTSRVLRLSKLARVLQFYADKARRHYLPESTYKEINAEIDRMVTSASSYSFGYVQMGDRGFIFCPEFAGAQPLDISMPDSQTKLFLFGPERLPNSNFRPDSLVALPPSGQCSSNELSQPTNGPKTSSANGHISKTNDDISGGNKEDPKGDHDKGIVEKDTKKPICFGTDVLTNSDVLWNPTIKGNPHLMIVGLPGMGKTTCLTNLCKQLLYNGIKPILFSYHQDIDEKLKAEIGSIRFVDFHGLGFNPMQVIDRGSRLAYLDVAGAMRDIFAAIFPEIGDIQGERIRQAVKHSFVEIGWDNTTIDPANLQVPDFKRLFEILRDTPKPDRGLQNLLVRLQELADYDFFDIGELRGSLWDGSEPVVIRLHGTQNDYLQRAFASLVFYGLYKDMFRRGMPDGITHSVIFDEAHRAAGLKLIPTMAKECRKYGISLVLASQEARDFNTSLFSTIANYLVLRLNELDARVLIKNVASSDQERVLIDRIKQLDRFKALYFRVDAKRPSYVALKP